MHTHNAAMRLFTAMVLGALACGDPGALASTPGNDSDDEPDHPAGTYLGQPAPDSIPVRFAPSIIPDGHYPHSTLTITPGGNRVYWTTFLDLTSGALGVYESDFDGLTLSTAKRDTTLAAYGITGFVFLNENTIVFGAQQPYEPMGDRVVGAIWTSQKTESGWTRPQPIESTVDTAWASIGSVSVNSSGDIYFVGRTEGGDPHLYSVRVVAGSYQPYEPLPTIINTGATLDPFVDYQDRYLLFAASDRPDNVGVMDLFVSFKDAQGHWTQPRNLRSRAGTQYMDRFPMVTRDGKYLFFVTSFADQFPSASTHYYWVDAGILDGFKP
jgi:hypothetical protein